MLHVRVVLHVGVTGRWYMQVVQAETGLSQGGDISSFSIAYLCILRLCEEEFEGGLRRASNGFGKQLWGSSLEGIP